MNYGHIVILVGGLLVAVRLFFPVLQCPDQKVVFLSYGPRRDCTFHEPRTYTQAVGLGILTFVGYVLIKRKNSLKI